MTITIITCGKKNNSTDTALVCQGEKDIWGFSNVCYFQVNSNLELCFFASEEEQNYLRNRYLLGGARKNDRRRGSSKIPA